MPEDCLTEGQRYLDRGRGDLPLRPPKQPSVLPRGALPVRRPISLLHLYLYYIM
jgi:hypothetical protein